MDVKEITLTGLASGAAEELWMQALTQVLDNLADPNTDHAPKREILLKFMFKQDDERRVGAVQIACTTKLAGVKGVRVLLYYGRHEGIRTAVEAERQEEMFPTPSGKPRPVPAAGEAS